MRSCSSPVLVEQTAEQVASAHPALPILADDGQPGGWVRRLQARAPGGDGAGCSARRRPGGPAPGGRGRRSAASPGTRRGPCRPSAPRTRSPWAPAPASPAPRRPPSGTRRRSCGRTSRPGRGAGSAAAGPRSPSTSSRLRACWVTQAPSGLAVTPARWTRRVSSSMKNSTYSRRSQTVSTVKKSQATIPAACWRRNARQVVVARRGAGSSPWRRSVVRIAVAETRTPSRSSSPLDALVAPARVLPGQADDQLLHLLVQRWSPGPAVRVGPGAGDQPPVPAQQRLGLDEEARPAGLGAARG